MTDVTQNPWDAAANAVETTFSNDIYGRIEFDMWFCKLVKGTGRVPFDDGIDRLSDRRTAIDINIQDLGGTNYARSFIAEIGSDGWLKVTLPSLKALGIANLKEFNGSFVHAVMEPYGEYTDRDGNKKQRTAPAIKAVYPNAAACEASAQGTGTQTDIFGGATAAPSGNGNGNGQNGGPAADAERAVALAFLPAIVKTAIRGTGVDIPALDAALKGNPILAKHFNIGSPEVMQAIASATEPAF